MSRRKLISKTFLRDVDYYNLNIYLDNDDYYLCVKKIISMKNPYILETNQCLMDNGYYIVEVIPREENYTMRIFFNDKKQRLLYYFDITSKNGLDDETRIPYYDDLYLDVVIENGKIEILDEDELQEALNQNLISNEQFYLAYRTKDFLIQSINLRNNKYINLNIEEYLN